MFGKRSSFGSQQPAQQRMPAAKPEANPGATPEARPAPAANESAVPVLPVDNPRPGGGFNAAPLPPPQPAQQKPVTVDTRQRSDEYYQTKSMIFGALIEAIDLAQLARLDTESAREEIRDIVNEIIALKNVVLSIAEQEELLDDICNDVLGYGPLEPLLARDDIADIMVNGSQRCYIEVNGKVRLTNVRFRDDAHQAGTTATVELATVRGGQPAHTVAAGVPVSPGENTVLLDSATLPFQHLFWVRLTLTRPNGVATTTWSTGPVESGTPVEFTDMVPGNTFFDDVFWLVKAGVADGYSPDTYGAVTPVSRQAMAAFLYRKAGSPDGPQPACDDAAFTDVGAGHPFCGEIAWMATSDVARGFEDGSFQPTSAVSRQAMAAFLQRFHILLL